MGRESRRYSKGGIMAGTSSIEWTDATWNPITGCTKVSAGCANCYAEGIARRFRHDGPFIPWTVRAQRESGVSPVHLHSDRLSVPLRWKKPRMIFVNSMSDLFHEEVPEGFIHDVFLTMAIASQHTFQVLTKRPERAAVLLQPLKEAILEDVAMFNGKKPEWPLPNVWMGTSVENQKNIGRLDDLARVPAATRFLSAEPLLGPLEITANLWGQGHLDWVIAGGESGPKARPMHPEWANSIRRQCYETVPFFFKQWGEWCPVTTARETGWEAATTENKWMYERYLNPGGQYAGRTHLMNIKFHVFEDGTVVHRVGRKGAGAHLAGQLWREMPSQDWRLRL